MDSDKGSEESEELPIIDEPSTKPVALEKVVQYSDPRVKEKLEPFIPDCYLKESKQRTIVPDPRLLEVPRSTLNPRAPPFPQPNSECGTTSKVSNTDSTSVLESVVANMNLIATGTSLPPPPPPGGSLRTCLTHKRCLVCCSFSGVMQKRLLQDLKVHLVELRKLCNYWSYDLASLT